MSRDDSSLSAGHPSREDLAAFNRGQVTLEQQETIAEHLQFCEACVDFLSTLDPCAGIPTTVGGSADSCESVEQEAGFANLRAQALALFKQRPGEDEDVEAPLELPATLGEFELYERLGKGGMGIVYRAWQAGPDRFVAVKIPYGSAQKVQRFRREYRRLGQLDHPHIVKIYSAGEVNAQPYLAMELLEGGSLATRLAGKPLPPNQAARLALQITQAIGHAHAKGIVHRDLKPSNVLLTPEGLPKVCDFGLAIGLASESRDTEPNMVVGCPPYMAPEQVEGTSKSITNQTDVYGLGALLYELLTGRPPFGGATVAETLYQVTHSKPVPPRTLNPALDRDLDFITLECLQKVPAERYGSALELEGDLARYLAHLPLRRRPPSPLVRCWRACRRNPVLTAVGSLAAAALIAVTILSLALNFKQAAALRESQTFSARVSRDRAQERCEAGDSSLGLLWFARALEAAPPDEADLQRTIRVSMAAWGRHQHQLNAPPLQHPGEVLAAAFNPKHRLILTGCADGNARLWDAESGRFQLEILHPAAIRAVAFSPDGKWLLTGSDDGIARVCDVGTGKPKRLLRHEHGAVLAVAFGPDGSRIFTAGEDALVHLWEPADDVERRSFPGHKSSILAIACSPDGQTIVTGSSDRSACLWEVATGARRYECKEHGGSVNAVAFHPSGAQFATGCAGAQPAVQLWETATGKPVPEWSLKLPSPVQALAFGPDGETIMTGTADRVAQLWEVATAQRLGPAMRHRAMVRAVAYSPNGAKVVTAGSDNCARLWQLAPRESFGTAYAHEGWQFASAAFSRDGTSLLAGTGSLGGEPYTGEAWLWRPARGGSSAHFECQQNWIRSVAFDAKGAFFVTAGWDGTARVWNATQPTQPRDLKGHTGSLLSVAFHPTGNQVLTGSADWTARLWNIASGTTSQRFQHAGAVNAVAFSDDGNIALTGSADRTAFLWDLSPQNRAPLCLIGHEDAINAVALSPDGRMVLTGSADGTARLWFTRGGAPCRPPLPHNGSVLAAVFSPDGKTVATGCSDQCAYLWDVATGVHLGPPLRHQSQVTAVAFSPGDGLTIVTCAGKRIHWWDAPSALSGDPERLRLWSQVITGMELDVNGAPRELDPEQWRGQYQRLRSLGWPSGY
jgi:WD40 repeat protein/serine/threonine protein kinase